MSSPRPAAAAPPALPDAKGRYGAFGGRYVPETLVPALDRLQAGIDRYLHHPDFQAEFKHELKTWVGRPTALSHAPTLSKRWGAQVWLKREDLDELQARQLAILHSAMGHVTTRGRLIYSTCSLEKEENEEVIEHAMAQNSSFRVIECRGELEKLRQEGDLVWPDVDSLVRGPYLRTLPGVHPCDGFFAAILEK